MKRNDKRNYVRCLWCGRQPVQVKRGRLVSHLNPGGIKCIAIGQRADLCKPKPEHQS